MEKELEEKLGKIFGENTEPSGVKLLQHMTEEEQRAYCKANGLTFEESAEQSDVRNFIEQLAGDDSSLKFGLLKSLHNEHT